MLVRVHDKERDIYFKSEVYAILNVGWFTQYLVLVPDENSGCLKLFDFLDKTSTAPHYDVLVNIVTPQQPEEWISKDGAFLLKVKKALSDGTIKFDSYRGYSWLFDKPNIIAALLSGESVPTDFDGFKPANSTLDGWNYINTHDDIDFLMKTAYGFHDSCIENMEYISGACVSEDKSTHPMDDIRTLKMIIGSQWCDSIELIFEGLLGLNLRPAGDNYDSIIFSATLRIRNETILFADGDLDSDDFSGDGTCARALSLRWRFTQRGASV